MASEVGVAYVSVLPSTRGFGANLTRGLSGEVTRAGTTQGRAYGQSFQRSSSSFFRGVAGGFFGFGLFQAVRGLGHEILGLGIDYQNALNTFQAVTRASTKEMGQARAEAIRLGNDLTLPATSAADAANAMTELAKGGLSVRSSLAAARGTLQLAAAAQIDGAQAAQIQANALNEFRLRGTQAGHVADVLANAANAASGEITDIANALSFVGPVARAVGVSLDDTGSALALLAKNGILASKAGTSLRGIFSSLEGPSSKGAKALKKLGIEAFDNQGRFVGLRKVIGELSDAQKRLNDAQFAAAVKDAFNRQQLAAVNVLATEGVKGFDAMSTAVTRSGGAADLSRAKMKGLGGALQALQSNLETVAITLFTKSQPALVDFTHGLSDFISGLTGSTTATGQAADAGRIVAAVWNTDVLPTLRVLGSTIQVVSGFLDHHRVIVEAAAAAYIGFKTATLGLRVAENVAAGVGRMAVGFDRVTRTSTQASSKILGVSSSIAGGASGGAVGGPVGIALGAALSIGALALGHFAAKSAAAKAKTEELRASLNQTTGAITSQTRALVAESLQQQGVLDIARAANINVRLVTAAATGSLKAQAELTRQIRRGQQQIAGFRGIGLLGVTSDQLNKLSDAVGTSLIKVEGLQSETADVGEASKKWTGQIHEQRKELSGLSGDTTKATHDLTGFITRGLQTLNTRAKQSKPAGRSLVDGVIAGIHERQRTLEDVLAGLAATSIAAFKKANEISSPSKLYRRVGHNIIEGLSLGLDDLTPHVLDRLRGFAEHALSVFTDTTKKMPQAVRDAGRDAERQMSHDLDQLETLVQRRQSVLAQESSISGAVTGSLLNSIDLTGFGTTNPLGIVTGLRREDRALHAFRRNIETLRKRHFSKRLIDQLEQAGLDAAPLVANLAQARGGTLREINALTADFRRTASALGQEDATALLGSKLDKVDNAIRDLIKTVKGDGERVADALNGVARTAKHRGK